MSVIRFSGGENMKVYVDCDIKKIHGFGGNARSKFYSEIEVAEEMVQLIHVKPNPSSIYLL